MLSELTFRLTDTPTVEERVLSFLLDCADTEVTEAEVREALGLPRTTAHVALVSLVQQGVAVDRRVGRTKLYKADPADPLVATMKVARAIRRVRSVVEPVEDALDLVVLFGSAAQGRDRRGSDIDILVVTEDVERVETELAQPQWLQPVVMTSSDHMRLIAGGGTFATEVARGITVRERR